MESGQEPHDSLSAMLMIWCENGTTWDDPIDDHDLVVADPQKHMSITTSYGPSELLPLRGFRNLSASVHQSFELATPAALFSTAHSPLPSPPPLCSTRISPKPQAEDNAQYSPSRLGKSRVWLQS